MSTLVTICLFAGLTVVISTPNQADPIATPQPAGQVAVLHNGNYFEGVIREEEGGYRVTLPGGGEIFLSTNAVELVAPSLEQAYQLKAASARPGVAREQLDLTEWCLRNRLLTHAQQHLSRAVALDSVNRRIGPLQQRLQMAAEQEKPDRQRNERTSASHVVNTQQRNVDTAEATLRDLPPGSLEMFTEAVQPVLLNRCATAACHGATSSSKFRLRRPPSGERISRKTTLLNLQATVVFVDRHVPRNSLLVTAPAEPHGPLQHGLFAIHEQGQRERLARWVDLLSSGRTPRQASFIHSPNRNLLQRLPDASRSGGRAVEPLVTRSVSDDSVEQAPRPTGGVDQDPFDPGVFNHRYHGPSPDADSEISPR